MRKWLTDMITFPRWLVLLFWTSWTLFLIAALLNIFEEWS